MYIDSEMALNEAVTQIVLAKLEHENGVYTNEIVYIDSAIELLQKVKEQAVEEQKEKIEFLEGV